MVRTFTMSQVAAEIILILGSVCALYKVITLSVDEDRLFKAGVDLLRGVIRKDIKSAFSERVDNNRILARLAQMDSRIEYRPWPER